MKMLPYLVLTVALAAPATAQVPTPRQPVFSSPLRARLRAQIMTLTPQLRPNEFPVDATVLALPAAQVGDFDLALRLAKDPATRGSIWQWKATRLASAGKRDAALEAAHHIPHEVVRADTLLLLARSAVDAGQLEIATRALSEFSALKKGVEPDQLVYGGYLWVRNNQPDAARRLWKRAWPLLLAKSKSEAEEREGFQLGASRRSKPQTSPLLSQALLQSDAAGKIVPFIARAGMMGDLLPYLQPNDSITFSNVVMLAYTSWQRQILRDWLTEHHSPSDSENWRLLALSETFYGNLQEAHEDYDCALSSPTNGGLAAPLYELILANAWGDEPMRLAAEANLRAKETTRRPNDIEAMIAGYRLLSFQDGTFKVRANISREELAKATEQLIAIQPEKLNLNVLRTVASEWRSRGDNAQVLRVARTMVAVGRAKTETENRQSTHDWEPFWSGGTEMEGAVWLRLVGQRAEAERVAGEFAHDTPQRFRPSAAMILWSDGFANVAETIFDPSAEIQHQRALQQAEKMRVEAARREGKGVPSPKIDWSQFNGWDSLAAIHARFVAPDAPARWFGKLTSPQLKAQVLAAWIGSLSPLPVDKPPYVRHFESGRRVSSSASY